jgi:tRNA G26 N,N-dimethylase Trm1
MVKESDLERTLPKKVQRTLAKTRKLAEKQAKELREAEQNELRKVADKFLKVIKEEVDDCVFLCDSESLSELAHAVDVAMSHNIIKTIRDKGFSKELTELCDKVGRGKEA